MNWFYANGTEKAGPIEEDALHRLAKAGAIQPYTPVWQEGMSGWIRYEEIQPAVTIDQRAFTETGVPAFCSECGNPHLIEDMIPFGSAWVCAGCKNVYAQKLREGVYREGARRYGGVFARSMARSIDTLIVVAASYSINFVLFGSALGPSRGTPASLIGFFGVMQLVQLAIDAMYHAAFVAKLGATPGKMAMGVRVVRGDGDPMTFPLALGRYFATYVSSFILGIGFMMAAWDEQRRTLHDRICGTLVVEGGWRG
ncbi:MAG: RDD family protein [Bryobacteraceae bacterium]